MNKIHFEVEDDAVIKHTPKPEIGEDIYTTEVVMTKEIFQECYKKWIEPQESEKFRTVVDAFTCEDCVSKVDVKQQMLKYGFRAPDMTVTEFVKDCLPSVIPR